MTKMMENFDRMNKYLSDVDQRIGGLEKATREIMVNQKAQKENMQQHYMQILQKINELRTTMPLPGVSSIPTAVPIPTHSALAMPSYSLPVSAAPSRPNPREQEDLDAELARKLQAEFNVEASRTSSSSASTARTEPSEECPLCAERVPKSQIEQHVNKHLDSEESASRPSDSAASEGLWSRLFGKSEAEKRKLEEEAKKKVEEEAKKKAEEEAKKKQQQQQNATPVLTTIPQGYYLAPGFLPPTQPAMGGVPVVYRSGLYPGQPMMYPEAYPSNSLQ